MPKPPKDLYDTRAVGSGYYRVFVDGEFQSNHSQERKAAEKAGEWAVANPDLEVYYDHDLKVLVWSKVVDPPPDPEPEPEVPNAPSDLGSN